MDVKKDGGTWAWWPGGPKPVHDTMVRVSCAGSKELARSFRERKLFFFNDDKHFMKQENLTARRKGCDLTALMPPSSEGHFLETITWPQKDEASRVQSQPLTVHVWLNTLLSADLAITKRTASNQCTAFTISSSSDSLLEAGFSQQSFSCAILSAPWRHIGEAEVKLHSFLTSALDLLEWLTSFPRQIYPRVRTTVPNDYETEGGPRSGMDVKNKNILLLPGFEPRTVQPIA